MRWKGAALAGAALVLAVGMAAWCAAAESSGPAVGAGTPPFNVNDITGPAKGQALCYI